MKALQDAFRQLAKREVDTFPARVVSVDKANGTCVVSDGEIDYTDVQLSATVEDSGKRFYLFPKVGSFVLVSPINEDIHRLYVEFFSEVESFDLTIETTQLQIDQDGFLLKKENETLARLMADFISAIQNMVFSHPQGPTTGLINTAEFTTLAQRFQNLLKDD